MCGITGYLTKSDYFTEETLQRMTDSLIHRGPDESGYLFDKIDNYKIGLGHRRLSIIDLDKRANQPFTIEDVTLIYNGEIYNYNEIKGELISHGHRFRTTSDTEVILRSYLQWGIHSVEKFIGMFAYAIFDKPKHKIFIVRDRIGVKPLYYYQCNGDFGFSSELKAFSHWANFNREIDKNALACYFQYGYIKAPRSIFTYTKKLLSAHYIEYDIRLATLKEIEYWSLIKDPTSNNFEDNKVKLKKRLLDSFKYRMVSDVPVGVFLSGGFDSTAITAILQSNMTEQLKTFSIGFNNVYLDEAPNAKLIADHLNTDHHEYYVNEKDILELIHDYVEIYDEPFGDPSALPTIILSKFARKHVKVVLSGDGGDELFAGYNHYMRSLRMFRFINSVPKYMKNKLMRIFKSQFYNKSNILDTLYPVKRRLNLLYKSLNCQSIIEIERALCSYNISEEFHGVSDLDDISYTTDDDLSLLKQMMYYDMKTVLTDKMLVKVDRATMSQGLESREPFLDHHIPPFSFSLPDDNLINHGIKKHIIREIVYDLVPREIMGQKKKGFTPPLKKWIFEDLNDEMKFYINQNNVDTSDYIDPFYFNKMKTMYEKNNRSYVNKLWLLLVFQMWFHKWEH